MSFHKFVTLSLFVISVFTGCRPSARKHIPIDPASPEMVAWQELTDFEQVEDNIKDIYFGNISAGVLLIFDNGRESVEARLWWRGRASALPGTVYFWAGEGTVDHPNPAVQEVMDRLLKNTAEPHKSLVRTHRPLCMLSFVEDGELALRSYLGLVHCTRTMNDTLQKLQQATAPD